MVTAIDDDEPMRLLRLFNEPDGHKYMKSIGLSDEVLARLPLLGISGIANLLSAIKTAKYYEMTSDDVVITIATDSVDMYQSRLTELKAERGVYNTLQAAMDYESCLMKQKTDNLRELNYQDQKAIHNLKYFTWVEQQAKDVNDLNQLWYDRGLWDKLFHQVKIWDELIMEFNKRTGLLD